MNKKTIRIHITTSNDYFTDQYSERVFDKPSLFYDIMNNYDYGALDNGGYFIKRDNKPYLGEYSIVWNEE